MNCPKCEKTMRATNKPYEYKESGLNVTLLGITVEVCDSCGAEEPTIPAIQKLHQLLVELLVMKKTTLEPNEFRFLRTHLGMSKEDFAESIGGNVENIIEIESSKKPIGALLDRLIRYMACSHEPQHNYSVKLNELVKDIGSEKKPLSTKLVKMPKNWVEQSACAAE